MPETDGIELKNNRDRLKEILDSIETGIGELFESDRYRQYLKTMSRFHRYSLNNQMLIYMQMPEATRVASYSTWRDKLGRNVMQDQHGIKIIAPSPYKKTVREAKTDPATKLPVLDAEGRPVMEEKEIKVPAFRPVTVFDVSQTEGRPLPQLASDLHGDVKDYVNFMEALKRTSPVPVTIEQMNENMDGWFDPERKEIHIREGMSEVQTVSAALHEIAHSKLHDRDRNAAKGIDGKTRSAREVEAESVSYAVCACYGIETGENSFGYIAGWSKGRDLKELKDSLKTIRKASSELITDIDRNYAEILKEKGITRTDETRNEENERLYTVDGRYLHVQRTDGGFDYTLYDRNTGKDIDGGLLESDMPLIADAAAEICALHGLGTSEPLKIAEIGIVDRLDDAMMRRVFPDKTGDENRDIRPDPTIGREVMESFGYTGEDMLPLSKDRALELMGHGAVIHLLNRDNTETPALTAAEINAHNGLFGITGAGWESVKRTAGDRDIEKRFLDSPQDAVLIYQIRHNARPDLLFAPYSSLEKPPCAEDYKAVYTQPVVNDRPVGAVLEQVFDRFNVDRPADYTGFSLSVSDVVALKHDGEISYHYCDTIGFKKLEGFIPDEHLKNAEMTVEDDYGMIDGIINNGKKEKEPEKEMSLKEMLRQPLPKKTAKKTARSMSAEMEM
ncbi:MAG: DUF4316 domain-containing protein [Oscillospiraceae bacterium]|nr:DUF4316 domain-containing protein [Oscillospiraceae bacterium]